MWDQYVLAGLDDFIAAELAFHHHKARSEAVALLHEHQAALIRVGHVLDTLE